MDLLSQKTTANQTAPFFFFSLKTAFPLPSTCGEAVSAGSRGTSGNRLFMQICFIRSLVDYTDPTPLACPRSEEEHFVVLEQRPEVYGMGWHRVS